MSRSSKQLSILSQTEQKLQTQKKSLMEKRKQEIGCLAEKHGLLILSDEIWMGVLYELKEALQLNDVRIQQWAEKGAQFFRAKTRNEHITQKNPSTTLQMSMSE